jgi:hypothetical protein
MSRKDDAAIYDMLRLPPAVKGPEAGSETILPQSSKSSCDTFQISLAGMAGTDACYDDSKNGSATIAVIAAGLALGFAILFRQNDGDWQALHEKAFKLAIGFKIERAEDDIGLIQWMR